VLIIATKAFLVVSTECAILEKKKANRRESEFRRSKQGLEWKSSRHSYQDINNNVFIYENLSMRHWLGGHSLVIECICPSIALQSLPTYLLQQKKDKT
jgi:hypothetical protein